MSEIRDRVEFSRLWLNCTGWADGVQRAVDECCDGCKHFHVRPPGRAASALLAEDHTATPTARFLIPLKYSSTHHLTPEKVTLFRVRNIYLVPTFTRKILL